MKFELGICVQRQNSQRLCDHLHLFEIWYITQNREGPESEFKTKQINKQTAHTAHAESLTMGSRSVESG